MRILTIVAVAFFSFHSFAQEEIDGEVFEIFDVSSKADFPGGYDSLNAYIASNIIYPPSAIEKGIEGTVNVVFVVRKDGTLTNVTILGTPKNTLLEAEAIRVIKSTSGMWIPAKQRDKNVNMRFRIPIKFQLFGMSKKKFRLFKRK